jgi:hypothetical protein
MRVHLIMFAVMLVLAALAPALSATAPGWTSDFLLDKSDLSSTGSNPYFILEPGYRLVYKDKGTDLIITVLDETKTVDGVETRIVEERESEGGKLVEVSRNYFAISRRNNSVFYFGEDVDMYNTKGAIAGHGGSWHAGVDGAKAGVMIPGIALLGARYYQEVAPGSAMDRAEIVSVTESLTTPAGAFGKVMKTLETTPLEPGTKGYKLYAPGVGLIKDDTLLLVKHGYVK